MQLAYPYNDTPETHASLSLQYADEGLLPQACSRILKACHARPKSFIYNSIAGALFSRSKDYAASEKHYKRAVRQRPLDAETRYKLALVQLRFGKIDYGIRNLMFVQGIDPSLGRPLELILSALEHQQRWRDIAVMMQCFHDINSRRLKISVKPDDACKRFLPPRLVLEIGFLSALGSLLVLVQNRMANRNNEHVKADR